MAYRQAYGRSGLAAGIGRRLIREAIMGGDVVSRCRGRSGYRGRLAFGRGRVTADAWTETSLVITVD